MTIYAQFGVKTLINAKGTATRLSGGPMRAEVAEAMVAASRHCVDIAQLQAAASREIAGVTGAEAGYVASGASACLLLAAAACMAGLDPTRMARLPDTGAMPHEIIMVRSQRNFYDHALRAAGAKITEVGLPDRYAGAGVRDAGGWEIEAAISDKTAAIFFVAGPQAQPPLQDVTEIARRHAIPVIVDAAAQLPPQSNLRRFIEEGADLVAFSGGKAIGGPQASGFLCGKRDLVMSAALQHLDMDSFEDMWRPPPHLIDKARLKGMPQHGIGRSCKAGKEEIIGLMTALRLFVQEGDRTRHERWLDRLLRIKSELDKQPAIIVAVENGDDIRAIPQLVLSPRDRSKDVRTIVRGLIDADPAIHVNDSRRAGNMLVISPIALTDDDIPFLARGLSEQFSL